MAQIIIDRVIGQVSGEDIRHAYVGPLLRPQVCGEDSIYSPQGIKIRV